MPTGYYLHTPTVLAPKESERLRVLPQAVQEPGLAQVSLPPAAYPSTKIPEAGSRACPCQDRPRPVAQPQGEQQETSVPTQPAPGPTGIISLNPRPVGSYFILTSQRTTPQLRDTERPAELQLLDGRVRS